MASRFWVGGTGTWDSTTTTNWAALSGGTGGQTAPTNADTVTFDSLSGTGTVTVAASAVSLNTTHNAANINLSLSGSPTLCTVAGTFTLTLGTITLNNNNLTTGKFSSTGTGVRSIAFGTSGSITVNAAGGTLWTTQVTTNMTNTGTPVVNVSYAGALATTVLAGTFSEANSISYNFTAGTYALTFLNGSGYTAKSVDFTGWTGSWQSISTVTFYGGFKLVGGSFTNSSLGWTFGATSGTYTIDTNQGVPKLIFNGAGGTWNLARGIGSTNSAIQVLAGTFNTNNFALSILQLDSATNTSVRAINLGSSNVSLSSTTLPVTLDSTNLTFTHTGGTITCTSAITGSTFAGGGVTFYNVTITELSPTITGTNTFNNLTFTAASAGLQYYISFSNNQTINGTLTAAGFSATNRRNFRATNVGTQVTITAAAVSLSNLNFKDINAGGSTWSGTSLGNLGNNNNITFPAAKTVYLSSTVNGAAGLNWTDNIWATSQAGTPSAANFPLPQDTAFITNSGWNSSLSANTLQTSSYDTLCNLDLSGRTLAMIFLINSVNAAGSITFGSGQTFPGSGTITLLGNSQTLNFAGKTLPNSLTMDTGTGTVTLAAATTLNQTSFSHSSGTLNLNGFTLTVGSYVSGTTRSRQVQFGTNNIVMSGSGFLNVLDATNWSFTGTGGFTSTQFSSAQSITFGSTAGGTSSNAPNFSLLPAASMTTSLTITTGSWFNNLSFGLNYNGSTNATTVNVAGDLTLTGGTHTNVTVNMQDTGAIIASSKILANVFVLGGTTTISGTANTADPSGVFTVNGGTFTHPAGATLNANTIALTSGTVNFNGGTVPKTNTFNHTSGTVNVTVNTSLRTTPPATSGTYTFTAGTISISDGVTFEVGQFSSNNTNTRSIAFGVTTAGFLYLGQQGNGQTVLDMATATGFTWTGPGAFTTTNLYTRTIAFGSTAGGSVANAPNFTFLSTLSSVTTIVSGSWFNILDYGLSTFNNPSTTVINVRSVIFNRGNFGGYGGCQFFMQATGVIDGGASAFPTTAGPTGTGSVTCVAGTTTLITRLTSPILTVNGGTFIQPSGASLNVATITVTTGTLNLAGGAGTMAAVTTFNHTSGTVNVTNTVATAAAPYTFTAGTLSISDGVTFTVGRFISNNTNTRSIAFGVTTAGYIDLSPGVSGVTRLDMADVTGFTYTGSGGFTSSMGATATFTFGTTSGSITNSVRMYINGGTAVPSFSTGSWFRLLDFTGNSSTPAATVLNLTALTLTVGDYTALGATMVDTGTITTNSKTIAAFTVNHSGTTTLAGSLGVTTYTQTSGTMNFATFNLSCSGAVNYTGGTLNNFGIIACTTFTINGPAFTFSSGTISPTIGFFLTSGSFTYGGTATLSPALGFTTFNHTAGTVTFNKNWSMTFIAGAGTYTLTSGSLILADGVTLTVGAFSSSGTGTRSIAFGNTTAGNIRLSHETAGTTVLNMSDITGFTFSGLGGFTVTTMPNTRTFTCGTGGGSLSNAPNLTFGSGSSTATITSGSFFKNLDFGTTSFTLPTSTIYLYGNLTLSSTGTYTGLTARASGISHTITSNGKTITELGVNITGTATLADALSATTLRLNGGILSCSTFSVTSSTFVSTLSNTRSMTGSGTYTITGSGATAFSNALTGLTISGLTISMTSASAKTFAGGGGTYPVLNQGGAGALEISGDNSFSDLTSTTLPSTISFWSLSTQTFAAFTLSGTSGNLVTINSTVAGIQATLSKASGTVSVGFLSIRDSNATGGAAWYAGTTSTNVSNNTGWIFTAPGSAYKGNFFAFF